MKISRKLIIFVVIFYIVSQFLISFFLPPKFVYNNRINYDVFKDNVYSIEPTIKAIKSIIEKDKLDNYVIFIGDSVGYGTPCPPDKTMSSYMNSISIREKSKLRVFNLAIPSSMFGDYYTVILLLNKYGISTQNLILDFSYWEINAKTPSFWFNHYLKELDNESYNEMIKRKFIKEESLWDKSKAEINHFINQNIAIVGYSGFINSKIKSKANSLLKQPEPIIQTWSEKKNLASIMKSPANAWYYSDKPFNFSHTSPQLYFLNKIADLQKGKNTIFFLNAINDKLLDGATEKIGFKENIKLIHNYFSKKDLTFVDYSKQIKYEYFSDHVHLLSDGYEFVAEDLWTRISSKEVR